MAPGLAVLSFILCFLGEIAERCLYRLRKQTVEPVFGQIKQARGFRQFLLRGLDKTSGEWSLICTVHNLLKLAAGRFRGNVAR